MVVWRKNWILKINLIHIRVKIKIIIINKKWILILEKDRIQHIVIL